MITPEHQHSCALQGFCRVDHLGQKEGAYVNCMKALEIENCRLKKLLAERDTDIEILKEINKKA